MKRTFKSIFLSLAILGLTSCSHADKREHQVLASTNEISMMDMPENDNSSESNLVEESSVMGNMQEESIPMSELKESSSTVKAKTTPTEKPSNFIASSAGSSINDDDSHKFIRSAEMKFKVKNLPEVTSKIEDIIIRNKGFILRSEINNQDSHSTTTNITKDSALITYHYKLTGNLQLKVPHSKLDSTLREIAPYAIEIDNRIVDARDVTLQIMSDKLKQVRLNKKKNRITNVIDNSGAKLNDKMDAENTLARTLEEADRTLLSEYSLNEQIEYSLISIKLYQDETIYTEKILQEKAIEEYKPSLGEQMLDALYNGWSGLCVLLLLIVNIWPIIVIGAVVAFVYYRYKKRTKPTE